MLVKRYESVFPPLRRDNLQISGFHTFSPTHLTFFLAGHYYLASQGLVSTDEGMIHVFVQTGNSAPAKSYAEYQS